MEQHKTLKHKARVQATDLGHALRPWGTSIRIAFPLYISTCFRCGRPAVIRPHPLLFEDEFSGEALMDICPRKEDEHGPEINRSGAQKPIASKLRGV